MRATENQGSFLNRISIRRNQVVSMDGNHEQELEDIEIFQKHVADRFSSLLEESSSSSSGSDSSSILSIAFLRKLLDAFLCCEAEFKTLLIIGRDPSQLSKPPLDRLVPELLDRSVKALDICNAVTHGVDAVRHCQKLAEIAASALGASSIGGGQVRRAKKALTSLAAVMASEDKDCSSAAAAAAAARLTERSWSLGRKGSTAGGSKDRSSSHFRFTWWGMGKGWSASKQIQAMSSNLFPPRGAAEYNTLAYPIYIMSSVTVFVMWALVAAIPCQDRAALAAAVGHVTAPRQSSWATPMIALQERVTEEWKRKEKRGSSGLLDEMQRVERSAAALTEFAEAVKFPADEAALQAAEMAEACRRMEEGLVPLQQQIREVFHKIVKTRTEVLEVVDQGGKISTPTM